MLVLFILLAIPSLASAFTPVSGNQSGLWSAADSPFTVVGHINVPEGATLTIEPGVVVNFQDHYKFIVAGNLQAVGSADEPITFTTGNQNVGWGGILFSTPDISQLTHCRIEFGKTVPGYPDMHGGAVTLFGSDANFNNCIFADNEATADDSGMGGAVYAIGTSQTTFTDCQFLRNHCYGEGGAVKFSSDYNTLFTRCEFLENTCNYGGGAISGYGATGTRMVECLFADNYTMYANGGAVHALGTGNVFYFINCTLTNNTAVTGDGGAGDFSYSMVYFVNSIVFNNPGMYSDDVHLNWGSNGEVHYCNMNLPDGAYGNNNINTNPLFANAAGGDYSLTENSPSIDTGTAFIELDGHILVDMDPDEYSGNNPDMGAFEYYSVSGIEDELALFKMSQNYPNPFTTSTSISYTLPADVFVSARVFNVRGHEIRSLINSNQPAGLNFVSWNGRDNAGLRMSQGIYFMRLQAGNEVKNVRMVLTN